MTIQSSKVFCEDCKFFFNGITKVGIFSPLCDSEKTAKPNWKSKFGLRNPAILNKNNDCIYFEEKKSNGH